MHLCLHLSRFAWTYHRCWMFWHLCRTSKHSSSIEHAPKSSPTPLSPTELHTKARASISFGSSRMFRSSRVGLVVTKCRASSWFWHSWIQWHSSNIWETTQAINKIKRKLARIYFVIKTHQIIGFNKVLCLIELLKLQGFPWVYVYIYFFFYTFGPVKVFLLQSLFSSWRISSCRFLTQYWISAPPEDLAIWTKAGVQSRVARPHTNSCRDSKSVFWSDLVVQRVFRLNLRQIERSMVSNESTSLLFILIEIQW